MRCAGKFHHQLKQLRNRLALVKKDSEETLKVFSVLPLESRHPTHYTGYDWNDVCTFVYSQEMEKWSSRVKETSGYEQAVRDEEAVWKVLHPKMSSG